MDDFGAESLDKIKSDINNMDDENKINFKAEDNVLITLSNKENDDGITQCNKRNVLYTKLLSHYLDEHKIKSDNKINYKCKFFWVTIILFILIVLSSLFSLVFICIFGSTSISSVSIVAGSVGSMVSAIIVIPKIIAEHLFPRNDESAMIELVKNMQLNDASIRKNNKE